MQTTRQVSTGMCNCGGKESCNSLMPATHASVEKSRGMKRCKKYSGQQYSSMRLGGFNVLTFVKCLCSAGYTASTVQVQAVCQVFYGPYFTEFSSQP